MSFPAFLQCRVVFVLVCVRTLLEPRPANQRSANQEHGNISDEYEPQSTIN